MNVTDFLTKLSEHNDNTDPSCDSLMLDRSDVRVILKMIQAGLKICDGIVVHRHTLENGYEFDTHYSVDDGDIIDGCKKWDSAFKDDYADMERRDF